MVYEQGDMVGKSEVSWSQYIMTFAINILILCLKLTRVIFGEKSKMKLSGVAFF